MLMADEYNTEAIGEKLPHYDTVPSRFSANELLKETGPKPQNSSRSETVQAGLFL